MLYYIHILMQVELLHLRGRKMKVKGLSKESARESKFDLQEDETTRELSVEQYYKERYNREYVTDCESCIMINF